MPKRPTPVKAVFEVWKDPSSPDIIVSREGIIINISPTKKPQTFKALEALLG